MGKDLESLTDDIEDFDLLNISPNYQVWLIGKEQAGTDYEFFIDSFDSIIEAKKCASFFSELTLTELEITLSCDLPADLTALSISIEEVISYEDVDYEENIEKIDSITLL